MKHQEIIRDIQAKKYAPIYFLYGEESFFIDQISKLIETSVLDESEKAFNQTIIYGKEADFKQVVDHARQFPMMAPLRVVILKEAQEMRTLSNLQTYCENPSPQTVLVINYRKAKYDKRTAFWKSLAKHSVIFESKKIYDNQLPTWISGYVTSKNFRIGHKAANLLAQYLGTDLSKVTNELSKIMLSKNEGEEINTTDVQDNVGISKDYNVFELQNAIGRKDFVEANRIINYFEANPKNNPLVMVVGALFNYFSKVYLAKQNSGMSDQQLAKTLQLYSNYFLKDYRMAASKYSLGELERIFEVLKDFDLRSKGIGNLKTKDGSLLKEMIYLIFYPQTSLSFN